MRFGCSVESVGYGMSYFEAVWLARELIFDPSSHVAALLTDEEPISLEARRITDIGEALGIQYKQRTQDEKGKAGKPVDPDRQAKIDAALRARGHAPKDR